MLGKTSLSTVKILKNNEDAEKIISIAKYSCESGINLEVVGYADKISD